MALTPWRRRLLIVGLALVLLAVLVVALVPTLAGRLLPSRVEAAFAERFHGTLEVEALQLGWTGPQFVEGVRLLDPDGAEVARAQASLPGLWSLLSGRGKRLGEVGFVVSADLVTGADGRSNLERALEPRAPSAASGGGGDGDEPGSGLGDLRGRSADVTVMVEALTWRDERAGRSLRAEDLSLNVDLDPYGYVRVSGFGELTGEPSASFDLALDVRHLYEPLTSETPPEVALKLDVKELPVGLVDALAGQGGLLREVLGERATIALELNGTHEQGRLALRFDSDGLEASARGVVENGLFSARDGFALEADLRLPTAVWNERFAPLLPPDVRAAPAGDTAAVHVRVSRLGFSLPQLVETARTGGDLVAAAATGSELALDLTLGDWSVADGAMPAPLDLRGTTLTARLVPAGATRRAELELRAGVAGAEDAGLGLRASCADVAAALGAAQGSGATPFGLALDLRRLDSALVSARLGEGPMAELFGPRFDLTLDVEGSLALAGPSQARVALDLATHGKRLDARLDVELPEGPAAAPLIVRGELGGLDLLRPLVPAPRRESFDELVGERLALDLSTGALADGGLLVSAKLTGARLDLAAALEQGPAGLRTRGADGIALALRPSDALIARELGASLPEGSRVELLDPDGALTLVLRGLEWSEVEPAEGQDPTAAALASARAELELTLPGLRLVTPSAAPDAAPVPVELGGLRAVAVLAPESGLSLTATSRLAGSAEDAIDLRVAVPRPAEFLAEDTSSAPFEVALRCRAIPTALVDAIAAQDGLVVDVLGASADVELDAKRPSEGDGIRLALRSPTARLDLVGSLDDGVLRSPSEGGLSASMPLTPLYTKRIVGGLMPMLVGLTKAEGAPPAALEVTHFALPLDADLRKLACDIRLDLNQVSYRLVPGIADLLAAQLGGKGSARAFVVPPISLKVREGRVAYDALPLDLGDERMLFSGTFDLVTRELDLTTELPLAALGDTVTSQLAAGKFGLAPTTRIPLRLSGTPRKPKVSVPREFLEGLLKNAAEDAAKKGLNDLLNKALKKDG